MTTIEWTDATWNPVTGCDRVSPGCDNCYALAMARRLKAMGSAHYQNDGDALTSGPGFGVTMHHDALSLPLRWKKPRRVFVNSMSDLFHPDVTTAFIASVFDVMAQCPQHTFQVLTKRPKRMAQLARAALNGGHGGYPLANVWLGTTVETDAYLWRIDAIREIPAAVRFLSIEPLLGDLGAIDLTGIDWVIVGGESGRQARPMAYEWAASIRNQCLEQGVPFFFKQWGEYNAIGAKVGKKLSGRELNGHTWDEYPGDITESVDGPNYPQGGES